MSMSAFLELLVALMRFARLAELALAASEATCLEFP